MTWWDKLKAIATREAGAVKDELGRAAETLDEALAKKERELNATPAERVDMLLEEIDDEDARFDELEGKLRAEGVERAARAGIDPPAPVPPQTPNLTPILAALTVLPAPVAAGSDDKTSHTVGIDDGLMATLGAPGLDHVIADLQGEVMVLDATRRGNGIALRTPTLPDAAVADLVAAAVARLAPELAATPEPPEPAAEPAATSAHPDVDDPGDEGPEDLTYRQP